MRRASRSRSMATRGRHALVGFFLRRSPVPFLLLLFGLHPTSRVAAQQSTTEGFTLGLHVGSASVRAGPADPATGGGGGLVLGYGLTRALTVLARVDGANIEVEDAVNVAGAWVMGHVDLGARFHFAHPRRSYAPYLEGALTHRIVEVTERPRPNGFDAEEIRFSGGTFTLGAGVMVYTTETLAFDIGVLSSRGTFAEVSVGDASRESLNLDTRSTRLNIGVLWWL